MIFMCNVFFVNIALIIVNAITENILKMLFHSILRAIRKDINKWNRNTYNRSNKFSHFYFKTHYKRIYFIREKFDKKYNIAYDYDF